MDIFYSLAVTAALFSILILLSITWLVITISQTHAEYQHIPGPERASFILGNAGQIAALSRSAEDCIVRPKGVTKLKPLPAELYIQWHNEHGDTFVIYLLNKAMVISRSPDAVRTVLAESDVTMFNRTDSFPFRYIFGERFIGDAIGVTVDEKKWLIKRKIHDPMYKRTRLRDQIPNVNLIADRFLEDMDVYAESGESFDLGNEIRRFTYNTIMQITCSIDPHDNSTDFAKIAYTFGNEAWEATQIASTPFIDWNPLFHNYRNKVRSGLRGFRAIGDKIIRQRLTLIQTDDNPPDDLLTVLIRAHINDESVYSFAELIDEFVSFVIAGMDTAANTLSLLVMELGHRPDLLERLLAEVDDIVGENVNVTNDHMTRLPFMSSLIKETLRFYSPVSALIRETKRETNFGGFILPKSALAMINVLGCCRHPKYITDPDKFNPDRFDVINNKSQSAIPSYCNIPFSIGPRNCIGQNLANIEMKVLLAKFFQNYRLKLDESETFELGQRVLVKPLSDLKCTISLRK